MKNIRVLLSENFHVLEVKFSIYLNRRVFIMCKGEVKWIQHIVLFEFLLYDMSTTMGHFVSPLHTVQRLNLQLTNIVIFYFLGSGIGLHIEHNHLLLMQQLLIVYFWFFFFNKNKLKWMHTPEKVCLHFTKGEFKQRASYLSWTWNLSKMGITFKGNHLF